MAAPATRNNRVTARPTTSLSPLRKSATKQYDLSFNRYSEIEHDETVYEEPKVILQKLKVLEDKIQSGIAELGSILK